MKKKSNTTNMQIPESLLKVAVEQTDDVKGNFQIGLGAVHGNERQKIVVPDTRCILGSLDIDASTLTKYPQENRWDYAIEYNQEVFFIEIHPASTSDVSTVLAKLDWLKGWLKNKAPNISALKPKDKQPYHWVYTNKNAILPGSKYAKQLAQKNLFPVKQWDYSSL